MLKTYLKCNVCRLQDKIASTLIEPFTVIASNSLAFILNLPRKLRTHPVVDFSCLSHIMIPLVNRKALAPEGVTSSLINASSSTATPVHPVEAGCTQPSAVVCRTSRSGRDGSPDDAAEPTRSMTVHERAALDRGSLGVVFSPT